MNRWDQLRELCTELNFPEPELRKKMWVYVVDIPGKHCVCYRDREAVTEMAIEWCKNELNYHRSFN